MSAIFGMRNNPYIAALQNLSSVGKSTINRHFLLGFFFLFICSYAQATSSVLIEIDRGRTEGFFTKSPVFQRAILIKSSEPTDTALLFFRGYPGIEKIDGLKGHFIRSPLSTQVYTFLKNGIAMVAMDCPTDQWVSCMDNYRSSQEHADDVRSIMAKLRDEHGISQFYLMGHSMGSVSSRWLAKNLGNEIAGSIHSASMNSAPPSGFSNSVLGFPYGSIATPILHVHHENDGCKYTPYSIVKEYAGENLVTVRGGNPEGDPCRIHLHSYDGRENVVAQSIIKWIKTKEVDKVVGE